MAPVALDRAVGEEAPDVAFDRAAVVTQEELDVEIADEALEDRIVLLPQGEPGEIVQRYREQMADEVRRDLNRQTSAPRAPGDRDPRPSAGNGVGHLDTVRR